MQELWWYGRVIVARDMVPSGPIDRLENGCGHLCAGWIWGERQ